jgi:RNA polymerase sigma-70 factor (ECF subfamily)
VVVTAGQRGQPQADQALDELCRTYWYPLYAYVRRQGQPREDAQDLTQAFFARFLARNYLTGLNSEKGRFRAFLLASLKHFLANEWDRARCAKRGGQAVHLSPDWQDAEDRYQLVLIDPLSPDKLYDRAWAMTLLERVVGQLEAECAADGRQALFDALKSFLTVGREAIPYAQAAEKLGVAEGAARVSVHRLRRRYRELLRQEIAQTLANPAQVREEMTALLEAFAE